jgi:flagellar basal-body rod protein FlgG
MLRSLYSAASGMSAQQMNVDNIANNLANANTVGFKMRRAHFQDLLYQNMTQPGGAASDQTTIPAGLQLGLGTRASSNDIIFTEGNLTKTDNPLDLAIQGPGFFQIRLQNGTFAYTRDGSFKLDSDGNLVTATGDSLEPPIKIPSDAQGITISADGKVTYLLPNRPEAQVAGQIQIAQFQNPGGLNSIGKNLFTTTDASGEAILANPGGPEGAGTLLQNYLEQSNVSVVDEFINLIIAQRAYEANSKVVKAADDMYQQANNLRP